MLDILLYIFFLCAKDKKKEYLIDLVAIEPQGTLGIYPVFKYYINSNLSGVVEIMENEEKRVDSWKPIMSFKSQRYAKGMLYYGEASEPLKIGNYYCLRINYKGKEKYSLAYEYTKEGFQPTPFLNLLSPKMIKENTEYSINSSNGACYDVFLIEFVSWLFIMIV